MTRTASALATIDGDKANSKMSHNEAMQRSYEGQAPAATARPAVPDRPLLVIADTRRLVAPWWGYGSSHLQPADAALMVIVLLAIGSAWALGIVWTFSLSAVAQKADRLRDDALAGIVAAEVESNELVGELQSA